MKLDNTIVIMNKLREILAFIKALLGFLLNLNKKKNKKDGKEEKPVTPDDLPEMALILPGDSRVSGLVGGPFRNRPGLDRSVIDTLGVRGHLRRQLALTAGYALMLYAAGSWLVRMMG